MYGYSMVRCTACGLLFQDPQPSDRVLADSYYHDPRFTAELFGDLRHRTTDLAEQKFRLLRAAAALPRAGRALDVGCSSGAWLEAARSRGFSATGIEIGASTAEAARARGLDVRTGTLADWAERLQAEGPFDLITYWDVLEHVRRPAEELELARGLLSAGGRVAITCPNAAGWFPRLTYKLIATRFHLWEYPELPLHLYDFSPRTLGLLLGETGYRVVAVKTFGTAFAHFRGTTLSIPRLGEGPRGFLLRAAFELLHLTVYPLATLCGRGNSMLMVAAPADSTHPSPMDLDG